MTTISQSGQIALGEEHAGKSAQIEEIQAGVWVIKLGDAIPESELWLHEPDAAASLERGLRWAAENAPVESDLDELSRKIEE